MPNFHLLYVTLDGEPIDDAVIDELGMLDPQCNIVPTTKLLAQALQAETLDHYSLMLLDGVTASPQLKDACLQMRAKFRKPLLVLMADEQESTFVTLYALGVDECIVKPKNQSLLMAKICSWLRWSIALYGIPREDAVERNAPTAASPEHDPAHRRR